MSRDSFRLVIILSAFIWGAGLFQGGATAQGNKVEHVMKAYYVPHIAADGAVWDTYLLTDNLTNMPGSFTLTVYDAQGAALGSYDRDVAAFGSDVVDFHLDAPPGAVCASIETDSHGMNFRVAYHSGEGGVTEYPAPATGSPILALNFGTYYENIQWKGFSVWNASFQAQDVRFYAMDAAGNVLAEFQKNIPSYSRVAYLLDSPEAFGAGFDWRDCSRVIASGAGYLAGVHMSGERLSRLLLSPAVAAPMAPEAPQTAPAYQVIAWNDLGMHCYDSDFSIFSILPPYNSLWAQVIRTGPDPEVVTEGLTVSYRFENNTYSVGKTNFWDYDVPLFGVDLAPNVGLTGLGLSGQMAAGNGYFNAVGIPLTEKNDDGTVNHYQIAVVEVRDSADNLLAETRTVAPLSTEMHCSNCHDDGGIEGIATGNYRTNILTLHDMHNATNLMAGPLPVLCASCHPDNALGTTGTLPPLSHAMHMHHAEAVPATLDGCYLCHPGVDTKCLRGVMATKGGLVCLNCHGGMEQVGAEDRNYWLQEPDCGQCHIYAANPGALYRHSTGHGGVYCEACHGSTHAEVPSSLAADNAQPIRLQGYAGPLNECWVCHTVGVTGENPHETSGEKMRAGLAAAH